MDVMNVKWNLINYEILVTCQDELKWMENK